MPESPYQSMVENELLFQQEPWIHRVPYQIGHALRPLRDAAAGTGAGFVAGLALGRPRLGAALGAALGTAYGVSARHPTAAQHWAFNNPEKVHVQRVRNAYDYGQPELADLAHIQKVGEHRALARYGLVPKTAGFGGAAMGALATGLPAATLAAIHGGIEGAMNAPEGERMRGALYGAASRGAATGLMAAVPGAIGGHLAGNATHMGLKELAKQLIREGGIHPPGRRGDGPHGPPPTDFGGYDGR